MSNRRRLARERLEVYLVQLILSYRQLILIAGFLLLAYAIANLFTRSLIGNIIMLPAIFLLLLGNSYNVALYSARLAAWMATLGMHDD